MITAKDIMTTNVITINQDAPVSKAIDLLLKNKISGLPVLDNKKTLVGIITEKDIIQLHKNTGKILNMTVKDIMTAPVISFEEDESFEEICICLEKTDFRRVPVVSSGKVVGIISRPDITLGILQKISEELAQKE